MDYSEELRARALEYVIRGGSIKEACEIFKVSRMSIYRWKKKLEQQGNVKTTPRQTWYRKVDVEELEAYVSAHPDKYLYEIAEYFDVAISTIWNNLQKIGFVYKKKRNSI
jgi:transposase